MATPNLRGQPRHAHNAEAHRWGVFWPAALARSTSHATQTVKAAATTWRTSFNIFASHTTIAAGYPPISHQGHTVPMPHQPSPAPRLAAPMAGQSPKLLPKAATGTAITTLTSHSRAVATLVSRPVAALSSAAPAAVPRRGSTHTAGSTSPAAAGPAATQMEPEGALAPGGMDGHRRAASAGASPQTDGTEAAAATASRSHPDKRRRGRSRREPHRVSGGDSRGAAGGGGGGGDGDMRPPGGGDPVPERNEGPVVPDAGNGGGAARGQKAIEHRNRRPRVVAVGGGRSGTSSSSEAPDQQKEGKRRRPAGPRKAGGTPAPAEAGIEVGPGQAGGGGNGEAAAGVRSEDAVTARGQDGGGDAEVQPWVAEGTPTAGGAPAGAVEDTVQVGAAGAVAGGEAGPAGAGNGMSLEERIRACRSMEQLVELYDAAQREAEAQARSAALSAGAAAAAAGLAASAAGLPAAAVWMFLAAAAEMVAGWRQGVPAGYRTVRLREAKGMRTQLSRLLGEACGVVLWAERLPPEKVCLLLSLMVVSGARHPRAEQHLRLLVEDSLNSLEQYSSGEVALAASSFARLRYFPGKGWLETLLETTTGRLASWRPIDLGFLLWSMAKWKARAPPAWLEEYYLAFEGCCERVTERELPMVCWALGVGAVGGGPRPPESFTNRLMLEVQVRLPTLSCRGLAHVAWGLCCCDVKPPRFWLRDFLDAAKSTMPYTANGLSFSNLLWALAAWQQELHPGEDWLADACKHSARWLYTLDARSLAVLLLALSDLGHTPPVEWVGLALETAHRKLATFDPVSAVAVLWAVSRFERQRAAAAAAADAATEAAAGDVAAAAAVRVPPRRRRLGSLSSEELSLVADDLGFSFGFGPDGRTAGVSAATPLALRPPRKWLVRYYPLIKDFAMVAAGSVPAATAARSGRGGGGGGGAAAPSRSAGGSATSATSPAAVTAAAAAQPGSPASPAPSLTGSRFMFGDLDTNQMLDVVVALADLYVYPGDEWMAAHEARMALAGGSAPGGGGGGGGGDRADRGRAHSGSGSGGGGGGLSHYQWKLLMAAYAALDETEEGYAAPRAGELY